MIINAENLGFSALNDAIRGSGGKCVINGCLGQRFIGAGMSDAQIEINGIPGNALGAYLCGADIKVNGNVQDAVGDTMDSGSISVYGSAGDAVGYAMRGGEIFVKGSVGYRAGIHMKEYESQKPVIVIGGRAGSFLGEYQAGGLIIVLGMHGDNGPIVGNFPCTGMHGGKMVLRGSLAGVRLPERVNSRAATPEDTEEIMPYIKKYCRLFGFDPQNFVTNDYTVITPDSKNPYKQMYVTN